MKAYEGLTPLEIFRKIAFELKSYPDDVVLSYIELGSALFCADAYEDDANLALALMAAHLMVIPGGIAASTAGSGNAPKGVKSVKEGDLTITYQDEGGASSGGSANFKEFLSGSRFGEMLLMLRRTHGLGLGFTAVGAVCEGPEGYYFPNRAIH